MPVMLDDYTYVGGGLLRLKGPKNSKVKKKSKLKRKKYTSDEAVTNDKVHSDINAITTSKTHLRSEASEDSFKSKSQVDPPSNDTFQELAKTAAEIRHDERRKKMASERLKRDGSKSHKERVEDFNKHLSRLSEHHDMPRIGPG